MWLKNAFKRFFALREKRSRKKYDFTWMEEAQRRYPEAFAKTADFISDVEDDSHKIGIESGKPIAISTGGFLWVVVIGILSWTVNHIDEKFLNSLLEMVGKCQAAIIVVSFIFGSLEFLRFVLTDMPNISVKTLDRLKNKWEEILNKPVPKKRALEIIDVFLAQERAFNVRYLVDKSTENWGFGSFFVSLQFFCVLILCFLGLTLLSYRSETLAAVEKEPNPHPTIIIQEPSLSLSNNDKNHLFP